MAHRIVILGGGTGGTMMANRLRGRYDDDEATISVVDKDDRHVYQPGLVFLPFGLTDAHEIVRPRRRQLRREINFYETEIEHVDVARDRVTLTDGTTLPYDVLIVATGVEREHPLVPADTREPLGLLGLERCMTVTRTASSRPASARRYSSTSTTSRSRSRATSRPRSASRCSRSLE